MKRRKKKIGLLFALALLLGLAGLSWDVYRSVFRPPPGFTARQVVIPSGATVKRIAKILAEENVIRRPGYFRWYYQIFFTGKTLKSGEYFFEQPPTMKQVIETLSAGRVVLEKVTIQEGLTIAEMSRSFEESGLFPAGDFLAASQDVTLIGEVDNQAGDLEGYLFPDTYMIHKGATAGEMAAIMTGNFKKQFGPSLVRRCQQFGFSVRQAVTLASLIEKETSAREERFLISSVFHNRLRRGMSLDCDPTIVYALERDNRYDGKIGWDDLKYDSPYNTRLHQGLPPGPICNPGLSAIEAALNPAVSNYLYFVSKDGHVHQFSSTLEEHNRAVRRYIIGRHAPLSR